MSAGLFDRLSPEDREIARDILLSQIARRRRLAAAASPAKRCPTCKRALPLSRFAKDSSRRDGLRGQCRDCGRRAREARLVEEAEGWA